MELSLTPTNFDDELANPFPGLRAFEPNEAEIFFGRDDHIEQLVERLRTRRFLAVVGGSGSGKSSLVAAGLIPWLASGFMVGAHPSWIFAHLHPGNAPLESLAEEFANCFGIALEGGNTGILYETILGHFQRGPVGVVEALREIGFPSDENLLILVDQFEELFRYESKKDDELATIDVVERFIQLIIEAADQDALPIYVVITMRSEFLGRSAEHSELARAINEGIYLVPRLTRAQARQAIEGPIRLRQRKISRPAVNRILNDMGCSHSETGVDGHRDSDQLPVMQHAMMRIWNDWCEAGAEETIDLDQVEKIGDLHQSLSDHADEIYDSLDYHQKNLCETLFRCLTEQTADDQRLRRAVPLREICEIAGTSTPEEVIEVADMFRAEGRSFLRPPSKEILTPDTVIDISHESLIRQWDQLSDWVDQETSDGRRYVNLRQAAEHWRADDEFAKLLRGDALNKTEEWIKRIGDQVAWAKRYGGELDLVKSYIAESRRYVSRQQRTRWLLVGLAIIVVVIGLPTAGLIWFGEFSERGQIQGLHKSAEQLVTSGGIKSEALGDLAAVKAIAGDVDEAIRILQQNPERYYRQEAMRVLLRRIVQNSNPEVILEIINRTFPAHASIRLRMYLEAGILLGETAEEYFRAARTEVTDASSEFEPRLIDSLVDGLIQVQLFEEAVEITRIVDSADHKSRLERRIASGLSQARRHKEALAMAALIAKPSVEAEAYVDIVSDLLDNDNLSEAESLLWRIPSTQRDAFRRALKEVVKYLLSKGEVGRAEALVIPTPEQFGDLYGLIAKHWAIAGDLENATATLRLIENPQIRADAIAEAAAGIVSAGARSSEILEFTFLIPETNVLALKELSKAVAIAHIKQGELERARDTTLAIPKGNRRYSALAHLAVAYAREGRVLEAEGVAKQIHNRLQHADALGRIAAVLAEQGDKERAQRIVERYALGSFESKQLNIAMGQRVGELLNDHASSNAVSRAQDVALVMIEDPYRSGAFEDVAEQLLKYDDFAAAEHLAQSSVSNRDQILAMVAEYHLRNGKISTAETVARAIQGTEQGDWMFIRIAEAFAKAGDLRSARLTVEQMIAERSAKVSAFSRILIQFGRKGRAR